MIEPTAEMLRVMLGKSAHRALEAVLAIVERDYRLERRDRALVPPDTVKVKWVCRRCGAPLSACETCGEPSQCGDSWCTTHVPDGTP
uniref:hypothetical protein n=1 Tax=Paractinoplanes polyasparticus TaxID=2856853 RepID=UPI001C84A8E0|nr:hypothetical protein [Actinoplanes polyasparticus]